MFVVRTVESRADPLGQLVGAQQTVGLNHLAFAMNPLGLHRIEPRALLGQQTTDDPHPFLLALFEGPVVRSDPPSDLVAYVPAGVVPDQYPHLLTELFELLAAPLKELGRYGAHRATTHKPKPTPFEFGQIQPVAGDGLRVGVVLFKRLLDQTQSIAFFAKAVQGRLRCSAPPTLILKAHNPIGHTLRKMHQSIALSFFLSYRGSGEVIQCLALCQRTPIRAKVARTLSPLTCSLVKPSSKLTSAAIPIVHKLLSLPNSLGLL